MSSIGQEPPARAIQWQQAGNAKHGKPVSLETVYHVGDLSRERVVPYTSQEGSELSVSVHPEVWEQLIKSGGLVKGNSHTTYKLTNPDGEFYFVNPSNELETETEWCLNTGFIEWVAGYRVTFIDENGDERYLKVEDEHTAREEAEARQCSFSPEQILSLGPRGQTYWEEAFGQPPESASPILIEGMLPIWYANELDVDGVWWAEKLAPENYSAPRGCIFQDKLEHWDQTLVSRDRANHNRPE